MQTDRSDYTRQIRERIVLESSRWNAFFEPRKSCTAVELKAAKRHFAILGTACAFVLGLVIQSEFQDAPSGKAQLAAKITAVVFVVYSATLYYYANVSMDVLAQWIDTGIRGFSKYRPRVSPLMFVVLFGLQTLCICYAVMHMSSIDRFASALAVFMIVEMTVSWFGLLRVRSWLKETRDYVTDIIDERTRKFMEVELHVRNEVLQRHHHRVDISEDSKALIVYIEQVCEYLKSELWQRPQNSLSPPAGVLQHSFLEGNTRVAGVPRSTELPGPVSENFSGALLPALVGDCMGFCESTTYTQAIFKRKYLWLRFWISLVAVSFVFVVRTFDNYFGWSDTVLFGCLTGLLAVLSFLVALPFERKLNMLATYEVLSNLKRRERDWHIRRARRV